MVCLKPQLSKWQRQGLNTGRANLVTSWFSLFLGHTLYTKTLMHFGGVVRLVTKEAKKPVQGLSQEKVRVRS